MSKAVKGDFSAMSAADAARLNESLVRRAGKADKDKGLDVNKALDLLTNIARSPLVGDRGTQAFLDLYMT